MKLIEPTRSARPSASRICSFVEDVLLQRPEQGRAVEGGAPPSAPKRRRVGAVGRQDARRCAWFTGSSVDAAVPQQRQPGAGPKHAVDLGERRVAVEPVEGLRDGHEVRRRRRRAGSARPCPPSDPDGGGQRGAHLRDRLDGDHRRAALRPAARVSFPVPAARSTTLSPGRVQAARARPPDSRGGRARRLGGQPREAGGRGLVDPAHRARSSASSENITRSSRTPWRRR